MAEMKFEDALKRLEKIVGELESGNLSLDESLENTKRAYVYPRRAPKSSRLQRRRSRYF